MLHWKVFRECDEICEFFIAISRILLMHDVSDSLIYRSARKSEDWELPTTTVNTKGRITS